MSNAKGFTLIEVLVALTVMSLTVVMLVDAISGSADQYGRVDAKIQGWMVASDKLVELQVYQEYPNVGRNDSFVERFGKSWNVTTIVAEGPYPDTRRVDVEVGMEAAFGAEQTVLWSQRSLIGKPHSSDISVANP